ncbi:hypothetical protein [Streptomyces phaeochromogenes]|uniref:hypothetical protein n=1 Tax=Streptomyces phaeochromogenes TaxID=1923 RepID=UPI003863449E|nr:hypothetical protein OG277_53010 [Streptomyces phaeochromogenes]
MTADPRPFTLAAEGTGPSELDYQGPQGWATVVHHAHQRSFTLIGAGNTQLVRDREHEEWRTVEPRTWEYRVGLSGPQRLRIEEAERWSISVTPLERDEVEDGGVFSRRGIGEQRVEIVKPGREGAAILEFTKIAGEPSTRPALFLLTEYGRELEYLSREDIGRTDRARFLIDADVHLRVWSPSLSTGQVMVVQADNCEWRLRVLPLSAARPVETTTTGTGADVLVHRGPPAAVTLRQEKHWAFVRMRGFDMEPGDSGIVHSAFHVRPSESDLIGVGPEPTLIQITGDDGWELRITPLGELRTFDREIRGTVGEVVRYTGPPATAQVSTASWHEWGGTASVGVRTAEFTRKDWVFVDGGPLARFRNKRLELLPGMLLTVTAPKHGSGWRIRAQEHHRGQRQAQRQAWRRERRR